MEDFFCFLKDRETIGLVIDVLTFVVGLLALWLFYLRNLSFEKQVETAEKNLFNDRLSRGIEALGHDGLAIRNSGLRLLHNLGNEAQEDSRERNLVVQILHGFIRDRAMMPQKDENGALPEPEAPEKRVDIVLGIKLLFDLTPQNERPMFPFHNLKISLDRLDLSGLDFYPSMDLKGANFYFSNLQNAYFFMANLTGAAFGESNLRKAIFSSDLEMANFYLADVSDANFQGSRNLTQEQLNFMVYQVGCPPLLRIEIKVPKNRAYEWAENQNGQMCRRFVHNDEWIESHTPWWYAGKKDTTP